MDKLVEREPAAQRPLTAAPALAVQFFLIPLAVVAVTGGIYLGFRTLLADNRTAREYLVEIRTGGDNRRWPAAYELSRLMSDPAVRAGDPTLVPGLVEAFAASKGGDPMVRRYLALALGRLDAPASDGVVLQLVSALDDEDSETRINAIWALGSLKESSATPNIEALYTSQDAGVRKMVVYALGAIPQARSSATLVAGLSDEVPDVQWNAAVALARHGRREGVEVLARMLDRDYLGPLVKPADAVPDDGDPVADVIITGLQGAASIHDAALRPAVESLSRSDQSLRVRQAALEALKAFGV